MKIRLSITPAEAEILIEGLQNKVDQDMKNVMNNEQVDPKRTAIAYSLRNTLVNRLDNHHALTSGAD